MCQPSGYGGGLGHVNVSQHICRSGPNLPSAVDVVVDHPEDRKERCCLSTDYVCDTEYLTATTEQQLTAAATPSGKSDSGFWSQSFDTYRVSMAALEDSADVDLDAILLSLSALGDELDQETRRVSTVGSSKTVAPVPPPARNHNTTSSNHVVSSTLPQSPKPALPQKPVFDQHQSVFDQHHQYPPGMMMAGTSKSVSPVAARTEFEFVEHYYKQTVSSGSLLSVAATVSAESPDNDSAFSDNVSCISSESGRDAASCMSSGSGSSKSSNGSLNAPSPTQTTSAVTTDGISAGHTAAARTDKIRMVHDKINEGDVKKLFVKMHFNQDVEKRFIIDERMDCLDVCQLSAEKVSKRMNPDCAIVEYLPELNIERVFEDHEKPFDNVVMWDRDGNGCNKLLYVERKDKYHFIARPEVYLTGFACKDSDYDELARRTLVQDSSFTISPPELEGSLYLRIDAKKAWKKCWFVLRSSGLYYSTKSKSKSSADLECLTSFDSVNLYRGINWKKKHKAPTDHGFALKLPQLQSAKAAKNIKFVCTDDQPTLDLWMAGIRIAKYGRTLYDNFNRALERTAAQDIHSDSSDSSAQQTPVVSRRVTPSHIATDSSAFEDDLTTGTIKRKPPHPAGNNPSTVPKLPFTTKTSQILMRSADERRSFASSQSSRSSQSSVLSDSELPPPPPELLAESPPTPLSPLLRSNGPPLSPTVLRNGPPLSPTVLRNGSPLSPPVLRSNGPLSPPMSVRSPPPPTPPKPAALLQRKPSLNEQHRHSMGATPSSPSHLNGGGSQQLPFLNELRNKSQSPLVTKKTLACVPEAHDILSQPSSPARRVTVLSPVPPSPVRVPTVVLTNGYPPSSAMNGYSPSAVTSSPVRVSSVTTNGYSPVPPSAVTSSPARVPVDGYQRTQSMSPMLNGRHPAPPPPRRSDLTKLGEAGQRHSEGIFLDRSMSENGAPSQRTVASSGDFMADLQRVLAQKKRHSALLTDVTDGMDYLPPPPPELLKAVSPTQPQDERRKPPPPPKRSDGTSLTGGGK
ncbi:Ras-associated and pleckstrin-like proteiny domains-containing protein 1 [Hypsibius exemplaris]|uniref:Ras-associated and pleckstrin-like proteiny domains-containing protein 1 n=1 Tax=Hypsibius exemplaris TaxID=2072580 RepID=A0A9X6NHQ5_HYPEX|nr:Ras-associated and pleckstrin-like proteiny domains-containing protein 1 [Hypsibius exemplaris]